MGKRNMTADGLLNQFTLPDQVALVTGAGRGLGRAISIGFADVGADIIAVARSADQLQETAQTVTERGRRCLTIPCDVTSRVQVEAMADRAMREFGKIDILVNNAGGVQFNYPIEDLPEDEWDSQIDLNLKAAFLCSQAVGKVMLKQGKGKIVMIGSIRGFEQRTGIGHYGAAKAGLHFLTKQLAMEWGSRGIWVNCIAAAGIRTTAAKRQDEARRESGLPSILPPPCDPDRPPSVPCLAEPEQYVPIAIFLASSASNHITGDIISPGGVALKRT